MHRGRVGVTTSAVERPSSDEVRHQRRVVARPARRCSSASPAGSPTRAAALAVPAALPDRAGAARRRRPGLGRTRGAGPRGLQHPQLGEVGGHLLVGGRPDRGHPADQGAGALGPLEHQGRVAVVEREPQAAARARSRPWPTRVLCRSRLPNDDCHACRSVRPARTWSRARRPSPRAWASSARTSRHSSASATGARSRRPAAGDPGGGVVELAAGELDPGRLQLERRPRRARGRGRAGPPTRASARPQQRRGLRRLRDLGDRRPRRRRAGRGTGLAWARKRRAARRATTRARAGSSRSRVQARVSSHSAWKVRSRREPYAVAAASSAADGLAGPAGRGQDLGAVLLDGGAVGGRELGREHRRRLLDHLQRSDQVAGRAARA